MKQLRIAVCDDNPDAAATLIKYIKEIMSYALIVKYESAEILLNDLRKKKHDYSAIFLAICMKEENGIDVARAIRKIDERIPLIFTTVSDQYYREAFDVFAFQYILKPVSYIRVKKVLERLKKVVGFEDDRILHFRYRSQIYTLEYTEITYISSNLHTVTFHLVNGNVYHCRGKLSDFTEQLENSNFFRCHQSFFVNFDAVIGMKGDNFILKDQVIPISRTYYKEAHSSYQQYLKKKTGK